MASSVAAVPNLHRGWQSSAGLFEEKSESGRLAVWPAGQSGGRREQEGMNGRATVVRPRTSVQPPKGTGGLTLSPALYRFFCNSKPRLERNSREEREGARASLATVPSREPATLIIRVGGRQGRRMSNTTFAPRHINTAGHCTACPAIVLPQLFSPRPARPFVLRFRAGFNCASALISFAP